MSELDDTARWLTPNSSEGTRFGVPNRLSFIGGSDARIIMGSDEAALLRCWQETRSEIEPVDLSQNLFIHLGIATEDLNRRGYEADSGELLKDVQRWARRPVFV